MWDNWFEYLGTYIIVTFLFTFVGLVISSMVAQVETFKEEKEIDEQAEADNMLLEALQEKNKNKRNRLLRKASSLYEKIGSHDESEYCLSLIDKRKPNV